MREGEIFLRVENLGDLLVQRTHPHGVGGVKRARKIKPLQSQRGRGDLFDTDAHGAKVARRYRSARKGK